MDKYLLPLEKDPEKEEKIQGELIELRNTTCLFFFLINGLFVVLVFTLQYVAQHSSNLTIKVTLLQHHLPLLLPHQRPLRSPRLHPAVCGTALLQPDHQGDAAFSGLLSTGTDTTVLWLPTILRWMLRKWTCLACKARLMMSQELLLLLKCCFTSTETVDLLGTGAQDDHLDFHTAPEL